MEDVIFCEVVVIIGGEVEEALELLVGEVVGDLLLVDDAGGEALLGYLTRGTLGILAWARSCLVFLWHAHSFSLFVRLSFSFRNYRTQLPITSPSFFALLLTGEQPRMVGSANGKKRLVRPMGAGSRDAAAKL